MTRSLRPDAVLVQAVIAGALSFAHLHDLAAAAGQDGWKAWAYPISVDLLLVAAWRRLRADGPSWLAWCCFLVALIASLGANIATAGLLDLEAVPAWLRIIVAAWPALAFLGGTLLVHAPTQAGDRVPDTPASSSAGIDTTTAHEPHPAPIPTAEPVAALPEAPAPAVAVPPALVDHARKVAADHHARTGAPSDAATLRARLGVPAPMAESIAAQLA